MGKPNRKTIVENILKLADKLFRKLLPTVPKELLEIDVTMPQLKILFILFIHGAMRMSALALDLGVTLATATGLVDRLVERGMVAREGQADDRRVVLCRLSDEGHKAISRIWDSARNNSRGLLVRLETAKLQMLTDVLETMLEVAEQVTGEMPQKVNTKADFPS
jgi:DNA-binding MarR family transcriptional regulator